MFKFNNSIVPNKYPYRDSYLVLKSTKDQISGGEDNPVGLSMKCCSERSKEATVQNLLSPRTTTQVGI